MKWFHPDRWSKVRARGFWHFVLVRGVLGWGVPMAFLSVGVHFWWLKDLAAKGVLSNESVRDIAIRGGVLGGVLFLAGGFFWGVLTWFWSERLYQRTLAGQ